MGNFRALFVITVPSRIKKASQKRVLRSVREAFQKYAKPAGCKNNVMYFTDLQTFDQFDDPLSAPWLNGAGEKVYLHPEKR